MFVTIKELPEVIRNAVKTVYGGKDIEVRVGDTVTLLGGGGQGSRSFAYVLNLATGHITSHIGSWGGANMFNPANRVDNDSREFPIPDNHIVIKGTMGYRKHAYIVAGTATITPLLPKADDTVTDTHKRILYAYRALKSFARRENMLREKSDYDKTTTGLTPDELDKEIDLLVTKGLLKRNKAGSTQITTAGKNTVVGYM